MVRDARSIRTNHPVSLSGCHPALTKAGSFGGDAPNRKSQDSRLKAGLRTTTRVTPTTPAFGHPNHHPVSRSGCHPSWPGGEFCGRSHGFKNHHPVTPTTPAFGHPSSGRRGALRSPLLARRGVLRTKPWF